MYLKLMHMMVLIMLTSKHNVECCLLSCLRLCFASTAAPFGRNTCDAYDDMML